MPDEARLKPGIDVYWRAWRAVRSDRQYGAFGGQSPISFAAIERYASRYAIEGTEFDMLLMLIQAMDGEYLAWVAENAPKPAQTETA